MNDVVLCMYVVLCCVGKDSCGTGVAYNVSIL
jgi:hypothetical protein